MKQLFSIAEPTIAVRNAADVFRSIQQIHIDYAQENFLVFLLDSAQQILCADILFKGGLNACLVDPKTIFRFALLQNANALIIAHNHPSGRLTPSEEDKVVFEKLQQMGSLLTIKVLDSVVFNEKEFYCMPK